MVSATRLLKCLCLLLPASTAVQGKKSKPEKEPKKEIEKVIQLRTHSIFAPYIDHDLQNRWWDFGADSYVNTNKHIRLTRAVPSQMGWLWSRLPINAHHYQIEVEFKISGQQSHIYGDGLALWLTTERAQPGPVFGSIDKFNGLGLFIDTYANARHNYSFPRIIAMLGDGQTHYAQGEDGEPNAIGACSASVRRTNVATKLKLTYIREESLDVKVQYKAWDEWSDCFTIQNIALPGTPFLGFSAMTGDVSDAHDVISVTTSSLLLSGVSGPNRGTHSTSSSSPGVTSSLFTLKGMLKLIFFAAVSALAVMAARTYARQRGGLNVAGIELLNRSGGLGNFQRHGGRRF